MTDLFDLCLPGIRVILAKCDGVERADADHAGLVVSVRGERRLIERQEVEHLARMGDYEGITRYVHEAVA